MLNNLDVFAENKGKLQTWIYIAVVALAISGIYSILIVLLRSPGVQNIVPLKSFFSSALIVHVNMSVLVFMLSIAAMWLHIEIKNKFISLFSSILGTFGMLIMAISPFFAHKAILNNYVPVIENIYFFSGLFLFLLSIFVASLYVANKFILKPSIEGSKAISVSIAIILLAAFFALFITRTKLLSSVENNYGKHEFYELMFWGFGHILQFVYFGIYIGFVYKIIAISKNSDRNEVAFAILSMCNAFLSFIAIYYHVTSDNYVNDYTDHMKYFGGLPFIALLTYLGIYRKDIASVRPIYLTALILSSLLFALGGVIALYISGTDVTIPAHYHGATVGITLGIMGFIYMIFIEYFNVPVTSLMQKQLFSYSIGQSMHILGLAWSGGYGALRKNHGEILSLKLKISMGVMGLGGLIAIISGLTFIIIVLKCIYNFNKYR